MNPVKDNLIMSNLNELAKAMHETAAEKGWHNITEEANYIPRYIANVHAEASEYWEAFRSNQLDKPCDKACNLTCEEEEIADILIRCLDHAVRRGVDIDRAVRLKHEYNQTRPIRHGKVA